MKYVLDTNVLSELMKEYPNSDVVDWVSSVDISDVYTTSISMAELWYGVKLLQDGKRKKGLEEALKAIQSLFSKRVLSFDEDCSSMYADIVVSRKHEGRPISVLDALIAATTCRNRLLLVTRNVEDFNTPGLHLVNPWEVKE